MLDSLLSDLRFSFRTLRHARLFTLVTLSTLTLGIGANSAIFSVIDGVLLRPLPYPEADRIVEIWNHYQDRTQATLAAPEFTAYKELTSSFEAMAAFGTGQVNLVGSATPLRVNAVQASDEIFRVLGASTRLGRVYRPEEDRPGAPPVALLSHELWERSFGASAGILGSAVELDGTSYQVIGILQQGVRLPSDHRLGIRTDVWVPLGIDPANPGSWGFHGLQALARLKPNLSRASAEADLDRAVELIRSQQPSPRDAIGLPDFGVDLWPLHDQVVGQARSPLYVLMGAVLGVLLVACANVANLLLARAERRRRELSVRSALGASRGRLFRQFFTESLLLTGTGAVLGVGFCYLSLELLRAWNPGNLPRVDALGVDSTVLLFSLALAVFSSLVFGIVPAFQLRSEKGVQWLRTAGRISGSRGSGRLRSVLVVCQLALATVLVSGSALFLRSFWNLQQEDLGFETSRVLTWELELPAGQYRDAASVSGFFRRLHSVIGGLPGVEEVGAVTGLPLSGRGGDWNFYYEGRQLPDNASSPKGDWQVVTPGYFETMQVPLLAGRTFRQSDDLEANLVVIINQALAETYFPGEDPIGQRIRMGGNSDNPFITIVGVVGNMRYRSVAIQPAPQIYLPLEQASQEMGIGPRRSLSLAIRTSADPAALAEPVRRASLALDPQLPIGRLQTLETIRSNSLGSSRFAAGLLTAFALLALLLGATGIYGVISYLVARRLSEMGIRLALGSTPLAIVGMVLAQGLRMAAYALPLGLLLAVAGGRLVQSQLYQVASFDPLLFGAVAACLLLIALLACYLPARQASRLDPARVLQAE